MLKKTILLLEDDVILVELIDIIFQDYDFQIKSEQSSQDIISKVSLTRPDLIIMDSHISGDSAVITTNILKNHTHFCKIPVILMGTNFDIVKIAIAAGADNSISKPFNIDEFEKAVLEYLNLQLLT